VEQIEEFIAWKGAFEIAYLLENIDDAPYKYEIYDILEFCFDNYKEEMAIFLNILIDALPQRKRLMPCGSLWKNLLKLEAHWMKKRRRVMIKRRKNGVATHVYLQMRVTL
jgi:hypothetical protein